MNAKHKQKNNVPITSVNSGDSSVHYPLHLPSSRNIHPEMAEYFLLSELRERATIVEETETDSSNSSELNGTGIGEIKQQIGNGNNGEGKSEKQGVMRVRNNKQEIARTETWNAKQRILLNCIIAISFLAGMVSVAMVLFFLHDLKTKEQSPQSRTITIEKNAVSTLPDVAKTDEQDNKTDEDKKVKAVVAGFNSTIQLDDKSNITADPYAGSLPESTNTPKNEPILPSTSQNAPAHTPIVPDPAIDSTKSPVTTQNTDRTRSVEPATKPTRTKNPSANTIKPTAKPTTVTKQPNKILTPYQPHRVSKASKVKGKSDDVVSGAGVVSGNDAGDVAGLTGLNGNWIKNSIDGMGKTFAGIANSIPKIGSSVGSVEISLKLPKGFENAIEFNPKSPSTTENSKSSNTPSMRKQHSDNGGNGNSDGNGGNNDGNDGGGLSGGNGSSSDCSYCGNLPPGSKHIGKGVYLTPNDGFLYTTDCDRRNVVLDDKGNRISMAVVNRIIDSYLAKHPGLQPKEI